MRVLIRLDRFRRQTVAAHILHLAERRRAPGQLLNAAHRLAVADEGPAAGRAYAYTETGNVHVSDRVFARLWPEPRNVGVGEPFPCRHGSILPENGGQGVGRLTDGTVGEMREFQHRLRVVISEQPRRGRDALTLHDRNAGVCMAAIVQPDIGGPRLLPDPAPVQVESRGG